MRLQKYALKVAYIPGKQLLIADALSRAHAELDKSTQPTTEEFEVHMTESRFQELQATTKDDAELQTLKAVV